MPRLISVLLLAACLGSADAMIYRPPAPSAMWDTWVFADGGRWQLFFLQSDPPHTWNFIGRAVSDDLLHWTTLPPIPTKGPAGAWDEPASLTGSTVRDGERVVTFYGAAPGGVQSIGSMTWDPALGGWLKHPGNPLLVSRPPHYAGGDWRDLSVYREADGSWYGFVCARSGGDGVELPPLGDKTLVAWVTVGDLDRRGGSVLTVEEPGTGRFDALVFGERAAGRWMPGSEGFVRTPDAETVATWPAETASPDTLIQVAAVYDGPRVRLYRHGALYAEQTVAEPIRFEHGAALVLGLRHTGAARPDCFFAGTIADARVYDRPLTAEQLAALRPGQIGEVAPIAWLDFAAGDGDRTGRFPALTLRDGAAITDGRLRLDGLDDYAVTPANPGGAACVGYLTSRDLETWEYQPPVYVNDGYFDMEVPDYCRIGDWHYLIFSSLRTRRDTGGRRNATGCWYAMARDRLGPYREPADPLILPSGEGRWDNYVARTIDHPDGRLCYHHTVGGDVCWAEPKLLRQNPDGTLTLAWWPRLAALETGSLIEGVSAELAGPGVQPLDAAAADVMLTARVTTSGSAGLTWRRGPDGSVGVRLDARDGSVTVERLDAGGARLIDRVTGVAGPGEHHLRVMVRAHRASVFVDDRWLFGLSLPEATWGDGLALWCAEGTANFREVRVAGLEGLR